MAVIDSTDSDCTAFIIFFQVTVTRTAIAPTLSSLECPLAVEPPGNVFLLDLCNGLINNHFPVLSQNFAQLQQNAIATQITHFSHPTQLN